MRIELVRSYAGRDGRAVRLLKKLAIDFGAAITDAAVVDVYILTNVGGIDRETIAEVFQDPVAQALFVDEAAADFALPGFDSGIEVTYKPGVTDPEALTAREALALAYGELPSEACVTSARQYLFRREGPDPAPQLLAAALHNPLIERATCISGTEWTAGLRFPSAYPNRISPSDQEVRTIVLSGLADEALLELSKRRLLSLSLDELHALRAYFEDADVRNSRKTAGLGSDPTDVELEMVAQTWSEHCKHKIFAAEVRYTEAGRTEKIDSLFKTYIRDTTEALRFRRPDLVSVFHDNAGVVEFDEDNHVCVKVETHNSPSALDPYGGAITGIVGVNRDILGTGLGARPIFNTNVLCFGHPGAPAADVPDGLLHPRKVLSGVHRGIVDGGNQSGIPVAAGAFLFDESYTGKPLVFCGTAGILPKTVAGKASHEKYHRPGDIAVVAGGRVGKDGIHGATFSSTALDEGSPTSAVQIGDPIVQKKLTDFLLEARDRGLYSGITDNGAGGLSSSFGEMAEKTGGVRIHLDRCLFKYEGLAPWEILVSESQERMSFAVPPGNLDEFLALAKLRGVEAVAVGEFTESGLVEVFYRGGIVCLLELAFLHHGLPRLRLEAEWTEPSRRGFLGAGPEGNRHAPRKDLEALLLRIMADPNVASKEALIRQYDHEVQGGSIVKPFVGASADGPSDGGVIRPRFDSRRGLTITHGICPRVGDSDCLAMAAAAVDEAFRAHIALGGDPDRASALDNFCWPDPVESPETPDGRFKLAQLVRACRGLQDTCLAYGLPLVSGKDSMKNDSRIGGRKVSVRPTLLVTVMGIIEDVAKAMTSDFKQPGDLVYLIGDNQAEMGGSLWEGINAAGTFAVPTLDPAAAMRGYRALAGVIKRGLVASAHDCADGGLAVALAESALSGRLGLSADLDALEGGNADAALLFSEAPARIVVSVRPEDSTAFEDGMAAANFRRIGETTADDRFILRRGNRPLVNLAVDDLVRAWKSFDGSGRGPA